VEFEVCCWGDNHPDGGVVFLNETRDTTTTKAQILRRRIDGTLHVILERTVAGSSPLATPAVDANGTVYTAINDPAGPHDSTIVQIDQSDTMTTGMTFDSAATEYSPVVEMDVSPAGDVYFRDALLGRIYKIVDGQAVATFAETVVGRFSVGPDDLIYTANWIDNDVAEYTAEGERVIVAGLGPPGFSGDGGPAVEAEMFSVNDIDFASDGSLLIADTGNGRIRRVDATGIISTVAGTGTPAATDAGVTPRLDLTAPVGVIADPVGGGFWVSEAVSILDPSKNAYRLAYVFPLRR
jgi:hypothetical protein